MSEVERKQAAGYIISHRKKVALSLRYDIEADKVDKSQERVDVKIQAIELIKKTNSATRAHLNALRTLHDNYVSEKQETHYIIQATRVHNLLDVIDSFEKGDEAVGSDLEALEKRDAFKSSLAAMPDERKTITYLENLRTINRVDLSECLDRYKEHTSTLYAVENDKKRRSAQNCVDYRKMAYEWCLIYAEVSELKERKRIIDERITFLTEKVVKQNEIMDGFYSSISDRITKAMKRLFPSVSFTVAPQKQKSLITIVGDVDNEVADYIDKRLNSEGIAVHVVSGVFVAGENSQENEKLDFQTIVNGSIDGNSMQSQCEAAKRNLDKMFESGLYSSLEERDYHFFPMDREYLKDNVLSQKKPIIAVDAYEVGELHVGDWISFGTTDGKSIINTPFCINKIANRRDGFFVLSLNKVSTK